MQITHALFFLAASAVSAAELKYTIPDELFNLFGYGQGQVAAASSAHAAADSAETAAACTYPAQFNITAFASRTPARNASSSYIAFHYANAATGIDTDCVVNASSVSLTANRTSLASRYACTDPLVSFIWTPAARVNTISVNATLPGIGAGKLTVIETACAGQTTRKFEATGSVIVSGLRCVKMRTADTVCTSPGWLNADFTSLQPSPLL